MNEAILNYKGELKFKGYFITFMECLWGVADEAAQKEEWEKGNYDPKTVYVFDEVYQRFVSASESIFALYEEVGFSEKQLQLIKKIYEMVENYNDASEERDEEGWAIPKTDAEIAVDPEWHKVRDYAKYVYSELTKDLRDVVGSHFSCTTD